ncbi:MAG: peptidyl-prolyl cis-trans isomerase [Nitrospirae bacterium]|nr:peptidyl-prolyl cis-trans isomerase [Nitrospirota bacterium]
MKFIYYIIAILLLVSATAAYQLSSKTSPDKDKNAALIINGKVITYNEFKSLSRADGDVRDDEFIDSVITKELLIQEAKKIGIDKDEPFRRSIQNYYEQSLIKLLIDRKFSDLDMKVSDGELDRHIDFINKKYQLTIFRASDRDSALKGEYLDQGQKTALCDDLTDDIKESIQGLKQGEKSAPVSSGEGFIVVRVDKIESNKTAEMTDAEKEKVRGILIERKKRAAIDSWIGDLRQKATIKNRLK